MKLEEQTKEFLKATDPVKRLTYTDYVTELVAEGGKPITKNQWDVMISVARGRQLTDTATVAAWLANMRVCVAKEHKDA